MSEREQQTAETAQIGYRVTETIEGAHPALAEYPLLPDDLLVREPSGTWMKEAPGLAVGGFVLTEEQQANLKIVRFSTAGLAYMILPGGSGA